MQNPHVKLHKIQLMLLKQFTVSEGMRFNQLLVEGLESEHMNYHLKKLLELDLVRKEGQIYMLTNGGKDYCNLLDDEVEIVEKQPKTSVILWCWRQREDGVWEHLLNKRLRHPYWGKVGRLTGKVRFGESLEQAAQRELFEEAGLVSEAPRLTKVYHKLRYDYTGNAVQDVLFYLFLIVNPTGKLIDKTPFQENFWISTEDFLNRNDLDAYDDLKMPEVPPEGVHLSFEESIGKIEGF